MNPGIRAPLVYVVDDDAACRDSLRWLLESSGYRVQLYATAEHFLARYEPHAGACLILDVRMPGMSGLALQEELLRREQYVPIIFVTGHGDVPMAVNAVKRGALDFLEKPFKDAELLVRVQSAVNLERTALLARAQRDLAVTRLAALSQREREVMERVVAGKLNKVIADELQISIKTVEAHRAHIMEKLAVDSVAGLVQLALSSRLPGS
jgi:two-component system, LuxR family, response regulator TtrR